MSYTRPSASAADASWLGAAAYTRPAAGAADAAFAPSYVVTGWRAANLGTPAVRLDVHGFMPVTFGTPNYPTPHTVQVSGFMPVNFGPVSIRGSYAVTGFMPVHLGTAISLVPSVTPLRPVHLGNPQLAFNVVGFQPVHFGAPLAFTRNRVAAWRATYFGTPTVPTSRTAAAYAGVFPTHLGFPVAFSALRKQRHLLCHACRLRTTTFGRPSV